MKKRNGFVTNSSSTSYICDVCHHDESGWDLSLNDCYMSKCENGHTFCDDHQVIKVKNLTNEQIINFIIKCMSENSNYSQKNIEKLYDMSDDELNDEFYEWTEGKYYLPSFMCPVCNLDTILPDDMLNYIFSKHGIDKDEIIKEIRAFENLIELKKTIESS